jgi:hypothetical protein
MKYIKRSKIILHKILNCYSLTKRFIDTHFRLVESLVKGGMIMKKIVNLSLFLFLVSFLIFNSCSKNTIGPDNGDGGTLVTTTIGPSGGELKTPLITITVPSGAFTDDNIISCSSTDENHYGQNAISATYLISIPADFIKPITISIRYTGTLKNETFISVGEDVTDPLFGQPKRIAILYPVQVGDSTVSCTLQPNSLFAAKSLMSGGNRPAELRIIAFTHYHSLITPHVKSYLPSGSVDLIKGLNAYLEALYTLVGSMGFNYHLLGNSQGGINLIYVTNSAENKLPVEGRINPEGDASLRIDDSMITSSLTAELQHYLAQRFLSLVFFYYTPVIRDVRIACYWFDQGIAEWMTRDFNSTTTYEISLPMADKPTLPLQGIPELTENTDLEGYSKQVRSYVALAEYFDMKYKISSSSPGLTRIYDERNNGKKLSESITSVLGEDETVWWPDFVKEYICGNVYNVPSSSFLASSKDLFTVTTKDTTRTFKGVFGDLAADIYTISIDDAASNDIGSLRFTAESNDVGSDYLNVLLFGMKGGKLEYLGRGKTISVTDVVQHTDNNKLLAVVTNSILDYPYRYDNDYSLTITAMRKTGIDLKYAMITLPYFYREYKLVYPDGKTSSGGGLGEVVMWRPLEFTRSGNVLTSMQVLESNDNFWGHWKKTSDIKITISPDMQSADLEIKRIIEDYDLNTKTTENYTSWDLSVQNPGDYGCTAVWGTPYADWMAEKHIDNLSFESREVSTDGSHDYVKVVDTWYCTGVVIEFNSTPMKAVSSIYRK